MSAVTFVTHHAEAELARLDATAATFAAVAARDKEMAAQRELESRIAASEARNREIQAAQRPQAVNTKVRAAFVEAVRRQAEAAGMQFQEPVAEPPPAPPPAPEPVHFTAGEFDPLSLRAKFEQAVLSGQR